LAAAELKAVGLTNPVGKPNDTLRAIVFPLGGDNYFIRWSDHWSFTGPLLPHVAEKLRQLGTSGLGVFERQGHEIVVKTRGYFHELIPLVTWLIIQHIIRLGPTTWHSPVMLPQGHELNIEEVI
jgi:hypothetical protein